MGQPGNLQREIKVKQIKNVLHEIKKAQEESDWNSFQQHFLREGNVIHVGTDVDEIWRNWEEFEKWMRKALNSNSVKQITEKETQINLSHDETVAWYSQLIDTCLETKGETTRIEGFRHTGVMILTNDKWKIVQSHISAPLTDISSQINNHLQTSMQY